MTILTIYYASNEVVDQLTIEIVDLPTCVIRRKPSPDPDDIPKGYFRCFVCYGIKTPRHFGDYVFDQKVCREYFPYVDEELIGSLIVFDRLHGFNNP